MRGMYGVNFSDTKAKAKANTAQAASFAKPHSLEFRVLSPEGPDT